MRILKIFSRYKKYVAEEAFETNLANQPRNSRAVLAQLRQLNVTDQSTCELEFFFYTDKEEKAADLNAALMAMGYSSAYELSTYKRKQFIITGSTGKIEMSAESVSSWAEAMCRVGYKHDCEFDGWGTGDF